jgi:hypothetical protein
LAALVAKWRATWNSPDHTIAEQNISAIHADELEAALRSLPNAVAGERDIPNEPDAALKQAVREVFAIPLSQVPNGDLWRAVDTRAKELRAAIDTAIAANPTAASEGGEK